MSSKLTNLDKRVKRHVFINVHNSFPSIKISLNIQRRITLSPIPSNVYEWNTNLHSEKQQGPRDSSSLDPQLCIQGARASGSYLILSHSLFEFMLHAWAIQSQKIQRLLHCIPTVFEPRIGFLGRESMFMLT